MPVKLTPRDIEALIVAMKRGEEYKPWQVAKREVFREYGIAGTVKDKIFTAMMYRAWSLQGLLDRVVEKAVGVSVEKLDAYTRAAARIYAFQRLIAHREGHEDITVWMEEFTPRILAKLGGDPDIFKMLVERIEEARTAIDPLEERLMVSRFIYERVASFIGENEAETLFQFVNSWVPPLSLRVNTLKTTVGNVVKWLRRLGYKPRVSPFVETVVKIERGELRPEVFKLVRRGFAVLQDDASAAASLLLAPRPGETIVDLCAAPGGKTSHLAELTRLKSHIIAFEPYPDRAAKLRETLERVGADRVVDIVMGDGRRAPDMLGEEVADAVLVDPPCSSTGTIAKNPDVRWRLKPEELEKITKLQRELLEAAYRIVKPGGRILYSVCSLLREEGEDIISWLLSKYHGRVKPLEPNPPLFDPSPLQPWARRAWPHRHRTSGFYYALLVKQA
ncbi:Fmu (Sun) domain protein [Pyrolobus fumarii 1A]|uniref:Fmu (Sun) domain protein n=1 Tax=Pyrolobus fumarii (strain DSM 11204 / 1A) TaxID=694429 RepID=G0EF45_PYRF1|nr:RsmB/NOP family class I SAM-dependent RNA methyltransferase [Pyrolobus fumarii]AEM38942.1 Fmu (Sun) domain protein [Pyrolobus fumarii 1A]